MPEYLLDISFEKAENVNALFESIYRALPDAVILMNQERIMQMVNPAFREIFGYKRGEVLGQSSALLYAEADDFVQQGEKLDNLPRGEILPAHEISFRRKDDSFFTGETLATIVRDKDGTFLGMLQIIRDISQRKAAESQTLLLAQERNRMAVLSKFLTDASHDFRHPLSRMTTHLYMLERKINSKVENTEVHISTIKNSIEKLDTLLNDLLLMTRLDSGLGMSLQLAYLNPILESIIGDWQARADKAGIDLRLDLNDAPFVKVDIAMLEIAIGHLLENAIRYTPREGLVMLVSICDEHKVYIHVQDTGIGINDYDQKHIWERFYTADESRNDKTSGSGLGLAIVKSIIEQHNGSIGVASELGEGSIFHITLPLVKG